MEGGALSSPDLVNRNHKESIVYSTLGMEHCSTYVEENVHIREVIIISKRVTGNNKRRENKNCAKAGTKKGLWKTIDDMYTSNKTRLKVRIESEKDARNPSEEANEIAWEHIASSLSSCFVQKFTCPPSIVWGGCHRNDISRLEIKFFVNRSVIVV